MAEIKKNNARERKNKRIKKEKAKKKTKKEEKRAESELEKEVEISKPDETAASETEGEGFFSNNFVSTRASAPTLPISTLETAAETAPARETEASTGVTRTAAETTSSYAITTSYDRMIYSPAERPEVSEMRKTKAIIRPEMLAQRRTMIAPANPEWEEVAKVEQETRARRDYSVREAGMLEEERDKNILESKDRRKYRTRG